MDNQPLSRKTLAASTRQPIDPAFRSAAPPANLPTEQNPASPAAPAPAPPTAPTVPSPNPAAPSTAPATPAAPAQPVAAPTTPTSSAQPAPSSPPPAASPAPNSSDIKTAAKAAATPAPSTQAPGVPPTDEALNLKELPEFDESLHEDSETKRILTIGGVIIGLLFLVSGVLYLVTKSKEGDEPDEPPAVSDNDDADNDNDTADNDNDDVAPANNDDNDNDDLFPSSNLPADSPTKKHLEVSAGENPLSLAEDYFDDASQQEVLELYFYDTDGDQLNFIQWAEAAGLTIPGYIDEILTSQYYVLLIADYDNKNPKLGLILQSIYPDYQETEQVLSRWENYLSQDLRPFIIFAEDFDFVEGREQAGFESSGLYAGGRFVNFLDDGSVSLNYYVMRDQIILADSFNAFEKVVQYVKDSPEL